MSACLKNAKHLNSAPISDLSSELAQRLSLALRHEERGFAENYLLEELLSKHPSMEGSNSDDQRRDLAIAKLLEADARCKAINEIGYVEGNICPSVLARIQIRARRIIADLLHRFDRDCLELTAFSNGASTCHSRATAAAQRKIVDTSDVSPRARSLAERVVLNNYAWCELKTRRYGPEPKSWFESKAWNAVFTVPKNALIDRAACKEPAMNMYLQKGAGTAIRRALRSVGIDLNDQTRNQDLARIGSIDGSLATIDLSSASDSISCRLVWDLLPEHVHDYLWMLRSHWAKLPSGELHHWNLFSTMGNGFTFELESLLFYAIAKSCCTEVEASGYIGVYGDDIIVPTSAADLLLSVLQCFGFLPNQKKTFTSGPFRESCGAHWYNGRDVKPVYVRKPLTTVDVIINVANRLRAWGAVSGIADPRLYETWCWLASFVPPTLRGSILCDDPRALVSVDQPSYPQILSPVSKRDSKAELLYSDGGLVHYFHCSAPVSITQGTSYKLRCRKTDGFSTAVDRIIFPQER